MAEEFEPARWRTGEHIVSESAAAANGWQTLGCEGPRCADLLDEIGSRLLPHARRSEDGRWQVRAGHWHGTLAHYGPVRATQRFSGFTLSSSPWVDARYAAVACRWRDDAGEHVFELSGGPAADYTGPDGRRRRLALQAADACSTCKSLDFFHHTWGDPAQPDFGQLVLRWHTSRSDKESLPGSAHWLDSGRIDRRPTATDCTLRPARP